MKWMALAALALAWAASAAEVRAAPLHDSVSLNIGLNCQWQQRCIAEQKRAMKRALKYVRNEKPPGWRIHLCNRNASRRRFRVDWVGFNNCIRNASLRPPVQRTLKRRVGRVAEPRRDANLAVAQSETSLKARAGVGP
jgi:hypothetical protein